ncbi:MAG: hypothetical protein EBR82_66235 [Caulobacteraceae bacterium]|nr:hypothetical protein [Caulobacteraceae bacterium]
MAIEKVFNQAPLGLEEVSQEPALEIEIEDPESVTIGIDGMELEIRPMEPEFSMNLAEGAIKSFNLLPVIFWVSLMKTCPPVGIGCRPM